MAAVPRVVYCCVDGRDDEHGGGSSPGAEARYTQASLRQTLQLMGCKPGRAHRAGERVFLLLQQRASLPSTHPLSLAARSQGCSVSLARNEFERLVTHCLLEDDPAAWLFRLRIACELREERRSVTILLCGTSGSGKSTLASLLASRLGISTVVATDSIRQAMRSFSTQDPSNLLWVSSYQAGHQWQHQQQLLPPDQVSHRTGAAPPAPARPTSGARRAAIQGFIAQCEPIVAHVERLVAAAEAQRRSIVVEGVHLNPLLLTRLMRHHLTVIPFLIHISNEAKHLERFAVRAKAMTLRPEGNRYVQHLRSIRVIQAHLCALANEHAVPAVDNTNVDRSVATIHATVLGCLRRQTLGGALLDVNTGRYHVVVDEYVRCKSATWSGRDMLQLIRNKSAAKGPPSSPGRPSTSAASTSWGPPSAGEAVKSKHAERQQNAQLRQHSYQEQERGSSFYGSDSHSSECGDGEDGYPWWEGRAAAHAGGSVGRGAGNHTECDVGSVLETEEAFSEGTPAAP